MNKIFLKGDKYTVLDNEDYARLRQYRWYLHSGGYAFRVVNGKSVYLHRVVLGVRKKQMVDHINMDKLDNRRSNLRICNTRINAMNSKIHKTNTSGYRGVSFKKDKNKWNAQIFLLNKRFHLGYFDNPVEAALAYNLRAKEVFGKDAFQNQI